jgi:hypothetical protein
MRGFAFATAATSLMLAACATTPPAPTLRPKAANEVGYVLAKSPQTQQTSHVMQHLDTDKAVMYQQDFGGGVGLGLLLGPLGVAANVAMIEKVTSADVGQLKGQVDPRPVIIFSEVAKAKGWSLLNADSAQAASQPQVTPYVLVSKIAADQLALSSIVLIEQGDGPTRWSGRYLYQLPGTYSVKGLAALGPAQKEAIRAQVKQGYEQLVEFIAAESQSRLERERPATFFSKLLTPRIEFDFTGSLVEDHGDVVWFRTGTAVYGLRSDGVKYSIQK